MGKEGDASNLRSTYIFADQNLNVRNRKNWKNHLGVKVIECVTTYL
jgi:hypothetical protein